MASVTLARAYQHSFETRPNVTLAITGGALSALGDAVAQTSQRLVRIELYCSIVHTLIAKLYRYS
jgi:protein Mpv17